VGDDAWGRWLRGRLEREGIDLRWFLLIPAEETVVAFAVLDERAVPDFLIYGRGIARVVDTTGAGDALGGVLLAALATADWEPAVAAQALPAAVAAAARSTEAFGALEALPDRIPLP